MANCDMALVIFETFMAKAFICAFIFMQLSLFSTEWILIRSYLYILIIHKVVYDF